MINEFKGKYYFLSNFYPSSITPWADNITYPTVEHAFQAMKSLDINERKNIAQLPTPGDAKYAGRRVKLRPDWNNVKIDIMRQALEAKFKNSELRELLLNTDDEILIEGNNWSDNFWGDCYCSRCRNIKGQNHLGRLLMEIREELKKEN